jgi:hypothetical protein
MGEGEPAPDWFEEFKKANQARSTPSAGGLSETKTSGSDERRKFPRFAVSQVACKLYRKGFTSLVGLSRLNLEGGAVDLSEGGVGIVLGERLLLDTKIHLRLEVIKFNDVLESDGVVRWCHEIPKHDPPIFHAGIMFLNLSASLGKKISSMRVYFSSAPLKAVKENQG